MKKDQEVLIAPFRAAVKDAVKHSPETGFEVAPGTYDKALEAVGLTVEAAGKLQAANVLFGAAIGEEFGVKGAQFLKDNPDAKMVVLKANMANGQAVDWIMERSRHRPATGAVPEVTTVGYTTVSFTNTAGEAEGVLKAVRKAIMANAASQLG